MPFRIISLATTALAFASGGNAVASNAWPLASPDFASLATADFTFTPASLASAAIGVAQDQSTPATNPSAPAPPSDSAIPPASSQPLDLNSAADNRFFERGSWRWQITGAGATEFDDHFAFAGVAASYFVETDFTIDFELNGLYFVQDEGDNTPGLNLALQLRWHFLVDDAKKWSVYFDTGFGVLFTGENVPAGGEQFSFTPQAGVGFSLLLDESSDARLLVGVKWHHTSNANLFEDNPGANKLMIYAGLNFPF